MALPATGTMQLYLRDDPRALILVTSPEEERLGAPAKGLLFKSGQARGGGQAVVEFLAKEEIDLEGVVRLTSRAVHGCLGLLNIGNG